MFFFFTLKTPKKQILVMEDFWFRFDYGFCGISFFFCFFEGHELVKQGSNGVSLVFWVQKQIENMFLGWKNKSPFSDHHNNWILGNYR